jgi:ATP-dependent Clp protease ATP-binding subunit ClpA
MNDLKLSHAASVCYHSATELAKARGQVFITPWHMALALLKDEEIQKSLTAFKVPQEQLQAVLVSWIKPCDPSVQETRPQPPTHNAELLELMGTSLIISGDKSVIDTTHIFLALLSDGGTRFSLRMISHGVDFARVESYFLQESCMSGGDAS